GPFSYGHSSQWKRSDEIKRDAFDRAVQEIEQTCSTWLTSAFPGRFARQPIEQRPIMQLLLTRTAEPFTQRSPYLAATGLSFEFYVWRSGPPAVWRIGFPGGGFRAIAAARRGAITMPNNEPSDAASTAHVADVLDDTQAPIVGGWSTSC